MCVCGGGGGLEGGRLSKKDDVLPKRRKRRRGRRGDSLAGLARGGETLDGIRRGEGRSHAGCRERKGTGQVPRSPLRPGGRQRVWAGGRRRGAGA